MSAPRASSAQRPGSRGGLVAAGLVLLALVSMLVGIEPYGASHGQDLPLVALCLSALLVLAVSFDERRVRAVASWGVARWWAGFLAWSAASAVASGAVFRAVFGAPGSRLGLVASVAFAVVVLLGATRAGSLRRAIRLAAPWFVLSESALALWQASSGLHPSGTASNSSYLGLAVVVVLPSVLETAVRGDDATMRPLARVALVTAFAALLAGQAYYALAASVLVVAGGWVAFIARRRGWSRSTSIRAGVVAVAVVCAAIVVLPGARATGGRFLDDRLRMWRPAVAGVADRPLIGHGPDGFRDAAYLHMRPEDVNHGGLGFLQVPADPHNALLGFLVSGGVPGLALALATALAVAAWWVTQVKAGDQAGLPFIAGAVLYGAGLLTTAAAIETMPLAALVLAASLRPPALREDARERFRASAVVLVACAAICAAGLASGLTYLALWRVDRPFSDPARTSGIALAWRVDPYLWYRVGLDWRNAGATGSADLSTSNQQDLAAMRKAVQLEPDNPVYLTDLGRALTRAMRFDESEEAIARALKRFPASVDARIARIENAVVSGRAQKVAAEVQHLLRYEDSADVHAAAALYYREIGDESSARLHEEKARVRR